MRTKTEIPHPLTLYKPTAESKYGLTHIDIFGFVARGEQTEDSDVDECYEREGVIDKMIADINELN